MNLKPKPNPSKFPNQSLTLKSIDTVLNHVDWLLRKGHQVAIVESPDGWVVSTTLRSGNGK